MCGQQLGARGLTKSPSGPAIGTGKNECQVDLGSPGFIGTWGKVGPTHGLGLERWGGAEEKPRSPEAEQWSSGFSVVDHGAQSGHLQISLACRRCLLSLWWFSVSIWL